ncbi:restriction endonuclease subunit S [Pseudomonas fluorescens]|uniref:Restriction endonuclease subunit S n=1 Tax=Pseudomonas fluorescens TaxID=294 RepID=A0A4Y9TC65_PSEFL|nr:restriction endonuclease subunit S [Pseudomonas fluorescens]TFW39461.1 restriction endonuclease subunit S [Pseudomonas fluorescens]
MATSQNATGWPTRLLVDCTSDGSISYGIVQPGQHIENGIPIVRVNNFKNGVLDGSEALRVSESIEENYRRTRLQGGEVLLTLVGSVGQTAIVSGDLAGWNVARAIAVIRPSVEVSAKWLSICLQTPGARHFLDGRANTTVQKTLNLGDVKQVPIPIPPKAVRLRIESIVTSIDDKIDVNLRIIQTLEAIAQALFKSWFIDFDPVRAKIAAIAEGCDPLRTAMSAISGKADAEIDALPPEEYEQLAAVAMLFPDEMDESAVVDIPKGWKVRPADSLSEVGIGKTPPRKELQWFTEGQGDWRWVSIRDMGTSGVFQQRSSEYLTSEAVARFNVRVVPDRTVLLSFKLTIGRVAITDGPMATNEAIAHFKLPCDAAVSSEYLYLYLKDFNYSTLGSTSSIADAVNSKTIREMPIIVARRDLIDRFTKSVAPLFEEMRNRQNEIASLSATRDALLPKLLSGEIEVLA